MSYLVPVAIAWFGGAVVIPWAIQARRTGPVSTSERFRIRFSIVRPSILVGGISMALTALITLALQGLPTGLSLLEVFASLVTPIVVFVRIAEGPFGDDSKARMRPGPGLT